jgi:hypothetical protein
MVNPNLIARFTRRWLRRRVAQRRFLGIDLDTQPILFGNSFPKSGTHLLTQILAGFARIGPTVESGLPPVITFEGETGRQRSSAAIISDLTRLLPGDIGYGHLHATSEIIEILCRKGFAPYFIYRDPRDVVVSHVYYVTDLNNKHVHHDFYVNNLSTFDEHLEVSILGRPDLDVPFPDIRARFVPYLPWLNHSEVLSLRYEDLLINTKAELERIFDHAVTRGFRYQGEKSVAIQTLRDSIKPSESPTFRTGVSGGWKKQFSPAIKDLFKKVTGDLLIRLGYEQNQNW